MAIPEAATRQYRRQQRLAAEATATARGGWRLLDRDALDATTERYLARVEPAVTAAQRAAATAGAAYVGQALSEQGIDADPAGEVQPDRLSGVASDGRPLGTLLIAPIIAVKTLIGRGVPRDRAMQSGRQRLGRIVATQVADAGRVATGVAVASTPRVSYVRMLNPPSCSRCAILAGRIYRWNAGFQRHPLCFPAGVAVDGPAASAATRRWYHGELAILTTASGQQLPLTGNHPVLTRRGWLPANLLNEGDEVVRSTRPEGATPLVVPDHHQMPSLIEDVWGALRVLGFDRVPSSTEDFHGDGQDGEVDVVYADGALRGHVTATPEKHVQQFGLSVGGDDSGSLDIECPAELVELSHAPHPGGAVRGGGLSLALAGGHAGCANLAGLTGAAARDSGLLQVARDDVAGNAVLLAERILARSGQVGGNDLLHRQVSLTPRWDAPGDPFSLETRGGYASRGRDLLDRLAGQVEMDRVVELRRVEWSGHVYGLTSVEGWHSANSLIVSNCDCIHIPTTEDSAGDLRTDPRAYFDSLSEAEQDRIFTRAGAQAVRDGADMSQVVNARRGMYPADGRLLTRESTTRRGVARPGRPMPETIYREAQSRDDAIRLLRRFGYITN